MFSISSMIQCQLCNPTHDCTVSLFELYLVCVCVCVCVCARARARVCVCVKDPRKLVIFQIYPCYAQGCSIEMKNKHINTVEVEEEEDEEEEEETKGKSTKYIPDHEITLVSGEIYGNTIEIPPSSNN